MLELGSSTKTLVIGPSATLSDALLEHGAWGFVGSVVDDSQLPDRGICRTISGLALIYDDNGPGTVYERCSVWAFVSKRLIVSKALKRSGYKNFQGRLTIQGGYWCEAKCCACTGRWRFP
jgi:hypothetical protein